MEKAIDLLWSAAEIGLYVIFIFIGLGVIAAVARRLRPSSAEDQAKLKQKFAAFEAGVEQDGPRQGEPADGDRPRTRG